VGGRSSARWKRLAWGLTPALATAAIFVMAFRHAPDIGAASRERGDAEPLRTVLRSSGLEGPASEDWRKREEDRDFEQTSSHPPDDFAFERPSESEVEREPADWERRQYLEMNRPEPEGASGPSRGTP
jgi:hypothetical protein